MLSKRFVFPACALLLASFAVTTIEQPAEAKAKAKAKISKKHTKHVASKRTGRRVSRAYLVPPPPPYAPSILPELVHNPQAQVATAETEEPVNDKPYSKYIYTRNDNDQPRSVQHNKYVTTWSPES